MKIELKEFLKSDAENVNNDGRERTSENFLLRAMRILRKIEQVFPELFQRLAAIWEHLFKKNE